MSLFDTIGSLLGKDDSAATSVPEALVAALGSHEGGLGGLIEKFQGAGLGDVVSSWVGNGQNQAVDPDALHGILGSDLVQQIAAKTGLPIDQLLPQIAQHLPQLVDHMTPDGQVPASGDSLLDAGLSFLKNRMG
ncbi:MAG TPA: YidB family protein [Stellaceae bacterium]|nr:YidB family protein [Stellaceae bacterium]